jgi:excinuclease ABC subunit A
MSDEIVVKGASEHNLKNLNFELERNKINVITGVSGSGKSSLAFDTILAESQRRFFYTLSHYTRQFLDLGARPKVRTISGLSPAISLDQNETLPSRKSTVGSLTDIGELLGVLYARNGKTFCPVHGFPTEKMTSEQIVDHLLESFSNKNLAILAPLAENKKGNFRTKMQKIAARGYSRIWLNGEVKLLTQVPDLNRESKHTIKLFVDVIKATSKSRARLLRSVNTALEESDGFLECAETTSDWNIKDNLFSRHSLIGGCPECGYAWPKLDSRYFSSNSLGKCLECNGFGQIDANDPGGNNDANKDLALCGFCEGIGLSHDLRAIKILDQSVLDCHKATIYELRAWCQNLMSHAVAESPAFQRVLQELLAQLDRLIKVGLTYLTISRRVRYLSGGEGQRLKLSGVLGENLRGILYVLDEPSQGLHPMEVMNLVSVLRELRDAGNTVIVVDHDEVIIKNADWVIDLGPKGGAQGGRLMAKFPPQDAHIFKKLSLTAEFMSMKSKVDRVGKDMNSFETFGVVKPQLNNLRMAKINFKKGCWNIVAGVSGAGKTSLVHGVVYRNAQAMIAAKNESFSYKFCERLFGFEDFDKVVLVDRKPVAKSSVSMPATYLDVFSLLREFYSALPDAQIHGLSARDFSLHVEGGRCEECKGRGEINLVMKFLPDARTPCEACDGKRYRNHVLNVEFNGMSISDVLNLSIDEAVASFANFHQILRKLKPAQELGLGYLKMGQPTASISGGEAQRLKLAPFLSAKLSKQSLLIIDEPTTGLHFVDVQRLENIVRKIVDNGCTVIMIEHNQQMIQAADWLVEIGPYSADSGGELVFEGEVSKLKGHPSSMTAKGLEL